MKRVAKNILYTLDYILLMAFGKTILRMKGIKHVHLRYKEKISPIKQNSMQHGSEFYLKILFMIENFLPLHKFLIINYET